MISTKPRMIGCRRAGSNVYFSRRSGSGQISEARSPRPPKTVSLQHASRLSGGFHFKSRVSHSPAVAPPSSPRPQVKAAVAGDAPHAPQPHLVEPLEVREALARDGVGVGILDVNAPALHDQAAGADLPGEVEVGEGPQPDRQEEQQQQERAEVGQM